MVECSSADDDVESSERAIELTPPAPDPFDGLEFRSCILPYNKSQRTPKCSHTSVQILQSARADGEVEWLVTPRRLFICKVRVELLFLYDLGAVLGIPAPI